MRASAICRAAAGLLLGGTVALTAARAEPPEPQGYRLDHYRAPTPATAAGAVAIDTARAAAIWKAGGAVWIDVLPAPRRPADLPAGAVWMPLQHRDIPGSLWLPEVGRGALDPWLERYFRANLDRATNGRRDAAVVFYCLADCWMSWNAAKRAASWGFSRVLWFRDGTDGWEAAGLPLAAALPVGSGR